MVSLLVSLALASPSLQAAIPASTGGFRLIGGRFATAGEGIASGGGWSLAQSLGGGFAGSVSGGGYTINGGLMQAARPAQLDLGRAHAYPVPYRPDRGHKGIVFTRLTVGAVVRVYTASGALVRTLRKADTGNDRLDWDVRNELGEIIASGLYFFVVESVGSGPKRGKLVVIR